MIILIIITINRLVGFNKKIVIKNNKKILSDY